eukprot:1138716-Pelagomonas_calceolata.AAC.2
MPLQWPVHTAAHGAPCAGGLLHATQLSSCPAAGCLLDRAGAGCAGAYGHKHLGPGRAGGVCAGGLTEGCSGADRVGVGVCWGARA